MFRSEQQKMRLYKANLKKEAVNNFRQGEALDEYLLYEKGIESQKSGLSKFAAAIGESVSESLGAREVKPVDKIKQWAATKDTGDWTTQTASNPALDANIVARSKKMPKSIKQPAGPKKLLSINTPNENILMGNEDKRKFAHELIDMGKKFKRTNANRNIQATQTAIDINEPVATSAFDKKAYLKRLLQQYEQGDTVIDIDQLAALPVKADYDTREYFAQQLHKMRTNANTRIVSKMIDVLEKQRMADAMEQFSKNATFQAMGEKVLRAMKQLTANAKTNKIVNEGAIKRHAKGAMDDMIAEIEKKAIIELARKQKKSATSTPATSIMSDAPQKIDLRAFNGRVANPDLNKNRVSDLRVLENIPQRRRTKAEAKRITNLKSALFRAPMALEDKEKHRPKRGSNLRK